MKPVLVRFACFGPYMDMQEIGFEAFEKNGLFLICGQTGSGKTTLLDAMCYALYARSSGGGRGDLESMRCKLAGRGDRTVVEFIFDLGGQRYRFVRTLGYGARSKHLQDEHNCMVLRDGQYVPLLENPTMTRVSDEAKRIIGLSYDQFRQVIILPQGQFERLLTSPSAEKEEILTTLFALGRWQRAVDHVKERVKKQREVVEKEQAAMRALLERYACQTPAQLSTLRAQQKESAAEMHKALQDAQHRHAVHQAAYEAALVDENAFAELEKRRQEWHALQQREEACRQEEARLKRAAQAEALRPEYERIARLRQDADEGRSLLEAAQRVTAVAQQAVQRTLIRQAEYTARRPQMDETRRSLSRMEAARPAYEQLSAAEGDDRAAQLALVSAQAMLDAATAHAEAWSSALRRAMDDQTAAFAAYQQHMQAYLAGAGARLALQLQAGAPCPVCGSTHHPAPAAPQGEPVTDAQLSAVEDALAAANADVSSAQKALAAAAEEHTGAQAAHREAAQRAAAAAATLQAAQQGRIDGVNDLQSLLRAIHDGQTALAAYEEEGERIAQILNEHQKSLAAAQQGEKQRQENLEQLEEALLQAQSAWPQRLAQGGFETEDGFAVCLLAPEEWQRRSAGVERFRAKLDNAREQLDQQQERVKHLTRPDMSALDEARSASAGALEEAQRSAALAQQRLSDMEKDEAALAARSQTYDEHKRLYEENQAFADHLDGRNGVSLPRYVLGVMLGAVTRQANLLLQSVHGGRYRLYRSDDNATGSRKRGLELEVEDSHSGTRRSVATLSGGEKFLVSLALAIGLSTVVQAQGSGVRMEALFIDEGFGSLDQGSIGDALEVLGHVQRSKGMVGIISHVDRLRETIPARIEITKTRTGSACRVRV